MLPCSRYALPSGWLNTPILHLILRNSPDLRPSVLNPCLLNKSIGRSVQKNQINQISGRYVKYIFLFSFLNYLYWKRLVRFILKLKKSSKHDFRVVKIRIHLPYLSIYRCYQSSTVITYHRCRRCQDSTWFMSAILRAPSVLPVIIIYYCFCTIITIRSRGMYYVSKK